MSRDVSREKVLVTGSAGFIGGYIVRGAARPRLRGRRHRRPLEVRPGRASRTTTTRTTDSSSATRATPTLRHRPARRLRPLHRGRGADRRDLLLPHLRLRPARDQRADHRVASATPPSTRTGEGALAEGHVHELLDGVRVGRRRGRRTRARSTSVPPPHSSYGFQKLAVEYFARAAYDQYDLPYTIVRPFNCVGIGEMRARGEVEVVSGNVKLAMSHVVPDLVQKVVRGQDPLHILGDGHAGAALHLRRRPRPGHRHRDGAPGGAQRGLQPLDRGVDHRARAGREHLATGSTPDRRSAT